MKDNPLKIKPIETNKKNVHPKAPHDALMDHEFTLGVIAPKGAGKTTVICNLLRFYRGSFHTILVFSPTVQSDDKWDVIKEEKFLIENKPLKEWIKKQAEKQDQHKIVGDPPVSGEMQGMVNPEEGFTGKIPEENFYDDYHEDTFQNIMESQLAVIKMLKKLWLIGF
jgi:hypothetical protein